MAALSPAQFWHVAPSDVRESIEEHGIDHRRGEQQFDGIEYPAGNYFFGDEGAAHEEAERRWQHELDEYGPSDALRHDVYAVDVDVPVRQDPFHDDESGRGESAVYTRAPIPPKQVKRVSA